MKFVIGDLVDYQLGPTTPIYTGVVLKKVWREEDGSTWFYKIYFIYEEDEAWICEDDIMAYGGYNGV
jgi:hypothetical protein